MVELYKLKLTLLQQGILRLLFKKFGKLLNARRMAIILGVSQPAVAKALPYLEKNELIKIEKDKDSGRLAIELNRENQELIWLKRADNLKQIYESGLVQFLYDCFPTATIILFGSYSRGDDSIDSDIDIAIINNKEKNINLEKYEEILERKININYYKNLRVIHKNLRSNILNGITLKGGIEPWD